MSQKCCSITRWGDLSIRHCVMCAEVKIISISAFFLAEFFLQLCGTIAGEERLVGDFPD